MPAVRSHFLVAFVLTALLMACGGEGDGPPQPVAHKVVDSERFSGVADPRTVLVADASSFAALWEEHHRGQVDQSVPPRVDFSQQMVLAVFAGQRADSCATIAVQKVYRTNTRLVVEYAEPAADTTSTCASVVAHPAQIVAVPRGPGPVEFVKVKTGQ